MGQGDEGLFNGMVRALAWVVQGLETHSYNVWFYRMLENATAAQLDGCGEIVGEPRLGRTDTQYKNAIEAKIIINKSCGQPETVITALRFLTGSTEIHYSILPPAAIYLTFVVNPTVTYINLYANMLRIIPAGVALTLVHIDNETPFQYGGTYGFGTGKLSKLVT